MERSLQYRGMPGQGNGSGWVGEQGGGIAFEMYIKKISNKKKENTHTHTKKENTHTHTHTQIKIKKQSVAFLYIKDKQAEKEIRETTPFTIVTNNIKYFGVTLVKGVVSLISFSACLFFV